MVAPRLVLVFVLGIATLSGCAGFQDTEYAFANWSRAEACWLAKTSIKQRWDCSDDYEKGWKAGYYDKSVGKACELPPVPPPCYWSYKYQGCEGQACIAEWYKGYQCGSAAAESSGFPSFHNVPLGPTAPVVNRTGCGACYAPDGCNQDQNYTPNIEQPAYPDGEMLGLIGPAGPASGDISQVHTASAEQAQAR